MGISRRILILLMSSILAFGTASGCDTPTPAAIPECSNFDCGEGGSCQVSTGTCRCKANVTGTLCDICEDGFTGFPFCGPDPCVGVDCGDYGSCYQGICGCDVGYGGGSCTICGVNYEGYPNCLPASCLGIGCNDHGTCSGGKCTCDPSYAGGFCEQCEPGMTGYPNCTCGCDSSSISSCTDLTALRRCVDQCTWETIDCDTICMGKGAAKSSGCGTDIGGGVACFCSANATEDTMLWTVSDDCPDGISPQFTIWDRTDNTLAWGPDAIGGASDPKYATDTCTTGHTICWGAWQADKSWGCGEGCLKAVSDDYCFTCGDALESRVGLNCNSSRSGD